MGSMASVLQVTTDDLPTQHTNTTSSHSLKLLYSTVQVLTTTFTLKQLMTGQEGMQRLL